MAGGLGEFASSILGHVRLCSPAMIAGAGSSFLVTCCTVLKPYAAYQKVWHAILHSASDAHVSCIQQTPLLTGSYIRSESNQATYGQSVSEAIEEALLNGRLKGFSTCIHGPSYLHA